MLRLFFGGIKVRIYVNYQKAWGLAIIYPQINLFERVSGPAHWSVLYAVESLTNLRLRDEVGDIRLVAPEVTGFTIGTYGLMVNASA